MTEMLLKNAPAILLWLSIAIVVNTVGHALVMFSAAQTAQASGQLIEYTSVALSVLLADLANKIGWATIPFGIAAFLFRMDRRAAE